MGAAVNKQLRQLTQRGYIQHGEKTAPGAYSPPGRCRADNAPIFLSSFSPRWHKIFHPTNHSPYDGFIFRRQPVGVRTFLFLFSFTNKRFS